MHEDLKLLLDTGWTLKLRWSEERQQYWGQATKPRIVDRRGTINHAVNEFAADPAEAWAKAIAGALLIQPRPAMRGEPSMLWRAKHKPRCLLVKEAIITELSRRPLFGDEVIDAQFEMVNRELPGIGFDGGQS